ncbi:MAG: putative zinc-binding metallopeptidase [Paracoccaceae bacterium]|nr:putative zinc-binding metallopeptidase [Maritimibacter sp.]
MRVFPSPTGDSVVFFDNLLSPEQVPVGYDPEARAFVANVPFCSNREVIGCNWIATAPGALCESCAMTKLAPDTSVPGAINNWAKTEAAKRWVLVNLRSWQWFGPQDTGVRPIFHMLAEGVDPVVMGHAYGVLTISIAESDPVLNVMRREALAESYRTMIGHLRHELAHMIWWRLSIEPDFLADFRALFGDEEADYRAALDRHYSNGPPEGWRDNFLTAYASAHPHEDWAETTAHLLHLIDIADSAIAVGLSAPDAPDRNWDAYGEPDAEKLTTIAAELAMKINHVNRSMGLSDLYPFVLHDRARQKLAFVHKWLHRGPWISTLDG